MSRMRVSLGKLSKVPEIKELLIDGDILVYTIGFAVEDVIEWPDGASEITGDLRLAKRLIDNRVRYFTNSVPEGVEYRLVITGDERCWRKSEITETYKAGRGRKPTDYAGIRTYLKSLERVLTTTNGFEADDVMAQQATEKPFVAIVSFDKDFFTVPGHFIHMSQKSSARLYTIRPNMALSFLFFQALAGDLVDSYKGVTHIGISKAAKLLKLCKLKGLTVRQAYLLLKACVMKRQRQFNKELRGENLWHQFRQCLDLAALTWAGEEPKQGIGLRRVFKYRNERFEYFVPYYDPDCTQQFTRMKM